MIDEYLRKWIDLVLGRRKPWS